jgi:hypothetical protein
MEQVPSPTPQQDLTALASKAAKLALKAGVSIVALLLLRGIIGSLPVIKNSATISGSLLGESLLSPLVLADAIIDSVILVVLLSFGLRLANMVKGSAPRFVVLGSVLTQLTLFGVLIFAYKIYELPAACFFVGRTDLVNLHAAKSSPGSESHGDFIREWEQVINQVNPSSIQNASGESLEAYQRLAVALFRRAPDYYGLAFLILIAIPIVRLVPLVYRNLDMLTDVLSHGAAAVGGAVISARGEAGGNAGGVHSDAVQVNTSRGPAVPLNQILGKLEKLKSLLDVGAISTTDFAAEKDKILSTPLLRDTQTADADGFLRLKALYESGALTEAEYEAQKQRALRLI